MKSTGINVSSTHLSIYVSTEMCLSLVKYTTLALLTLCGQLVDIKNRYIHRNMYLII